MVQRNFAFVQFDNDASAVQAINMENGTNMNGRKVTVKTAGMNPKRPNNQPMGQNNMNNMPNNMHNMNNNMNNMPNNMQNNMPNNMPMHNRARSRSPLSKQELSQLSYIPELTVISFLDNMNGPSFNNMNNMNNMNMNNMNMNNMNNMMLRGPGGPGPLPGFHGGPPNQFPGPPVHQRPNVINDCEIIVVSRELTDYAEWVENQLKNVGISADLLYPNEDIPIGKVLSNIAARGTSYAIVVTPENQGHRSINVTELFGDNSTEHRNMPVEDAIKFIHKNYHTKRKEIMNPQQLAITPIFPCTSLKEKHPDAIQAMLRMLTDNMVLTALQYDRLIKYLGERREMQVKAEIGDESLIPVSAAVNASIAPTTPAVDPAQVARAQQEQQENMQKKIMEILNKPSLTESLLKTDEVRKEKVVEPEASKKSLTEDPKIKLALASLLRNNIINKVKL